MNIFIKLLCNVDFPILAQNIGLACLTILIPVALAIFKEKEFEILDNNVVLDHVTKSKSLLIYIGLIFIPVIFWRHSSLIFRFFELIAWIGGVVLLCRILVKSYLWIKGDKFALRFEYLKQLSESKDSEAAWNSVWESEKTNIQNEEEFFKLFSERINELLK